MKSLFVIVIEEPEVIEVTTGSTVHLTCNALGSPDLTYTWLNLSQEHHVDGSRLTIPNVGRVDEMDYTCNVSLNDTVFGQCKISLLTQGKNSELKDTL